MQIAYLSNNINAYYIFYLLPVLKGKKKITTLLSIEHL